MLASNHQSPSHHKSCYANVSIFVFKNLNFMKSLLNTIHQNSSSSSSSSKVHHFFTMDRIIHWGSHFLLRASTLLESQSTMDSFTNRLVSLVSCLGATINPILEKFTGQTFNVKDNSCDEVGIDGEMLLHVAGAVGVTVAAIVLVWFLWKLIKVIFGCCCRRGRTMKAPGRNYRISRNSFERNPSAYFRNLRSDQRNAF
ncbi:hypothetical protein VNO80_14176 [Phaseolus coccineus]|uniref:Uncharacterized protein n=1 Tax=Phaseolus coccineus TaxID=3886 RepID=A0AAN9R1M6_PHACN